MLLLQFANAKQLANSETLSKYIAAFNYFEKTLLVLSSAASNGVSIASFATVIGAPNGITSTIFR